MVQFAFSHNSTFNADGFGPEGSFFVYCGSNFAGGVSSEVHFFSPLGQGVPEQRPGECGRRIAGRDACPAQKGGLPPQRGVFVLPLLTAPTILFRIHRICPHCGQKWTQFIPHENRTPCFALALSILPKQNRVLSGQKMRRGAGYTCPASRRFCPL